MATDEEYARLEAHLMRAKNALAEMRKAFDGATPVELRRLRDLEARLKPIDIVFDGPPAPDGPRFMEVENNAGESINVGEWVERRDGYWVLRLLAEVKSP